MPPPPLHPSLPPRPTAATTSNRPPPVPYAAGSSISNSSYPTPLSLPNRPVVPPTPNHPPRPTLTSSTSSFSTAASSPKLSASTSSAYFGKDSSNAPAANEAPWPRVGERLTPEQVKVNSELIELGSDWSVRWKCWKGVAIPLSKAFEPATDYDPFSTFVPSSASLPSTAPSAANPRDATPVQPEPGSKPNLKLRNKGKAKDEGPPKKKPRSMNAFDELVAEELGSIGSPSVQSAAGPSQPPTPLPTFPEPPRTDASTSRLDDQLAALRSHRSQLDSDPFERARRDLVKRGKERAAEGCERFELVSYVKTATTPRDSAKKSGEASDPKGKGKAKEVDEESAPAVGRTLWAFSVTQAGDNENHKCPLDELEYEGLECVSAGKFNHNTLYPALYSASSSVTKTALRPPSSYAAKAYPSVLSLSSAFNLALPALGSHPRHIELAAAHETFLAAIEDTLATELLSSSGASSEDDRRRWKRIGRSILHLPPLTGQARNLTFSSSSTVPQSPRKRTPPPATLATFRATLQRSTIFVSTALQELPYTLFPLDSSNAEPLAMGHPLLLTPLGLKASFLRRLRLDPTSHAEESTRLQVEWEAQLDGSGLDVDGNEWVVCRLDETDDATGSSTTELAWPADLVLIDGTRPPPAPTPTSSPEKGAPAELAAAESAVAPGTVASPRATFPAPPASTPETPNTSFARPPHLHLPPHDRRSRRQLADTLLSRSRRREDKVSEAESIEHRRDPLARRTNEVWRWMEDETARRAREAEEELEKERRAQAEEAERKRNEEAEHERKKAAKHQAPAAAPINMRTPMSLGTSSTEAPSPADVVFPLPGYTTAVNVAQNGASGGHSVGTSGASAMEIDGLGLGLYPSPEEGTHAHHQPIIVPSSTSQPMSSLDNAFASFDWGDGSYGTSGSGMAQGTAKTEFDDGMNLLGLTDDDFSFFDTAPTPLPGSTLAPSTTMGMPLVHDALAHDPFASIPSTTTSPKFLDHFSHLSTTPFHAAGSPSSPFVAQPSPSFAAHSSPPAQNYPFSFDNAPNAVEGGGHLEVSPAELCAGLATYATPTSVSSPSKLPPPAAPSFAVVLAGGPAPRVSPHRWRDPADYEALPFAALYASTADKYDPRRGKFGLPTPEADELDSPLPPFDLRQLATRAATRPDSASLEAWYTSVGDPRLVAAERLRRRQQSKASKGKPGNRRGWKAVFQNDNEDASDCTVTADEDSSSESEEEAEDDEAMRGKKAEDADAPKDDMAKLGGLLGFELLQLRQIATKVVGDAAARSAKRATTQALLAARDVLVALLAEHVSYNADFRSQVSEFIGQDEDFGQLVSSRAIDAISSTVNAVCGDLSPSPLFADHSAHPPLQAAASSSIVLRSQQALLETSTSAVEFWKPMGFEPVLGRKDVSVFVIYEEGGATMHDIVDEWLRLVETAYQGSRLGDHSPGTLPASSLFGGTQDGHLALPAGSLTRSLSKENSKALSVAIGEVTKIYQNAVFYVIGPEDVSLLSPSSPMFAVLHLLSRSKPALSTIVSCPVAFSQLCLSTSKRFRSERLVNLAFSIYDQLSIPVAKLRCPVPETFPSAAFATAATQAPNIRTFQAPAITLSPRRSRMITFDMSFPVSTLSIRDRHRFLHLGYSSNPANADGTLDWIYLSTIDDTGESWRVIAKMIKVHPGLPADVARVRILWGMIRNLIDNTDIEWRIVICKLGEPSILEIRAWDSILKEQLTTLRRPLHASFVYAELDAPLAVRRNSPEYRRASVQSETISEEGELNFASTASDRPETPPLFDLEASTFAFTPAEPVAITSSALVAPASVYLLHVPRIPTLSHASLSHTVETAADAPTPISIYGLHFLLSHASRTSIYAAPLSDLVKDVQQSFSELASLARVRWKTNGRLAWHLEAVRNLQNLEERVARHQDASAS
ncbi:hypothetical protein JCM10212_003315 [Sporobolomyces blumeae]